MNFQRFTKAHNRRSPLALARQGKCNASFALENARLREVFVIYGFSLRQVNP